MPNNQTGFSLILIIILIAAILIAGGIYWFQTISRGTASSPPVLHLEQISDPEKFNPTQIDATGSFCGGFAGAPCPTGYSCKLDGDYPDASGKCTRR